MLLREVIKQKTYEHVVAEVRRSPITLLPALMLFLVLFVLPIIVQWLFLSMFPSLFVGDVIYPLAVLFVSTYYLSLAMFFLSYFVDFYLDLLVLTNDRVIYIKQLGLFARTVFEVDLYQIENATSSREGTFATLFNFGDISIETSGPEPKVIAQSVSNPDNLRRQILDLAEVDKHYHLVRPK